VIALISLQQKLSTEVSPKPKPKSKTKLPTQLKDPVTLIVYH
jgi:hypothetical protein